ncbi:MAG TPA: transketolase C-terminal domain-containing protein [Bryobacteraceae bacterium]|nr:transketolase C-terminal domain-containing protein [Bryobacteraceae bacterium]
MRLGDHCGILLSEIAQTDPRVWVLDADLADSDGAVHFARAHPDRFIMAGASEQCMVSMAAGLSSCGARPWVFSFASFLCYRAYDQIRVCISQAKQPVTLVGSHSGGCGGRNGKTHLALNDIALMASLPGIDVWAPASPGDVVFAIRAVLNNSHPAYIRLPRLPLDALPGNPSECRWLKPKSMINLVSAGLGTHLAIGALARLEALNGLRPGLLHCLRVWPLPAEVLDLLAEGRKIVVIEDHYTFGGLASLIENSISTNVLPIGWPQSWPGKAGAEEAILTSQGLALEQIANSILQFSGVLKESTPK